ncbi:hypothetical protein C4F51_12900 [Cellvibrio sp. KB43]|uniref:Uncharacterized protein n=1 Tax=Cellvibrio polysaccharolyticus TaxID=2082724 RepID=A0A928V6J1_9GAMM|nr:hypothetical protein [Cellvibrio polysaccharolyticus]
MKQNMFCAHGTTIICDDGPAPLADIYALLEPGTLMTNGQGDARRAIRECLLLKYLYIATPPAILR